MVRAVAEALVAFYAGTGRRRRLPWREPDAGLGRATLVEGLLAVTSARQVAAAYPRIFAHVTGADWLGIPADERDARVAVLGNPRQKRAALDALAFALWLRDSAALAPAVLAGQPGIGPYIAGMVGLLHGFHAAPVDCNVERVAARAAPDERPEKWLDAILAEAGALRPVAGRPAPYAAISALLDLGADPCGLGAPECERCPLPGCRGRGVGAQRLLGFFADPYAFSFTTPLGSIRVDSLTGGNR
jgi:A/G-specific adenine glycosylase